MYRKRGTCIKLEEVLAKLKGEKPDIPNTPIKYSSADILAAKTILDRLLASAERNEVSSIEVVPKEIEEA